MELMYFLAISLVLYTNNCFCKSTFSNHASGHYEEHTPDGYKFSQHDRSLSFAKSDGGYKQKHGCHYDALHQAEDRYGDDAGFQGSSSHDHTAMNSKDDHYHEHIPTRHFSTAHRSRSPPSDSRRYQKRSIQDSIDNLLVTKSNIASGIRDIRNRKLSTTKAVITEIKRGIERSFAQLLGNKLFSKSNAVQQITRELVEKREAARNLQNDIQIAIRRIAQGVADELDVTGDEALAQSEPLNDTIEEGNDLSDDSNVIPDVMGDEALAQSDPLNDTLEVNDLPDDGNVISEVMEDV